MKTLAILIALVSVKSFAAETQGYILNPAVYYGISSVNDNGTKSTETKMYLNLRGGYKFSSPILVGATYMWLNEKTDSRTSTTTTDNAYGPCFGLLTSNIYLIFNYMIAAERKVESNTSITYSGGTGFDVDFGYLFDLGSNFSLGPQVSYYDLKFTKKNTGGADQSYDYSASGLAVFLSLWWVF